MKGFFQKFRWPYREDTLFSILSFIVFIVPLAFALFTNENFETIKLVLWLVLLGCALFVWIKNKFGSRRAGQPVEMRLVKPMAWLLSSLIIWALLAAVLAPDKLYGFFGFYYRFTNSFVFFALWATTVALLMDVLDRPRLIFLLKILFFDAVLIALKSTLEAFGLTLYLGESTDVFFRAAPSFLGNPNFSAMFMACLLPMAVVFWWQVEELVQKIYYSVGIFLILLALGILASRGALLALLAGCVVAVALLPFGRVRKQLWVKIVVVFVAALLLAGVLVHISRPAALTLQLSGDNITFRLEVWQESLSAIAAHPVFGIGLGNFALFHERLVRPLNMGVFDDPHNVWIFLAVSGGLPLLFIFLGVVIVPWIWAFRSWQQNSDPLILAALCSLVIFSVAASFTPVPVPCFLLLAVFVAGVPVIAGFSVRPIKLPIVSPGILAGTAICFIVLGAALGIGETALHFGYASFIDGNFAQAASWFKFSQTVNPTNQLARTYYIQSEIKLNHNPAELVADIQALEHLHPRQAATHVLAANDFAALFQSTQRSNYLDFAIDQMQQSLSIDREFGDRYGNLGFYYYLNKNYPTALSYSEQALQIDPSLFPSLIVEAKIYQIQNNRPELLRALGQAYKLNPDDPQVKYLWLIAQQETDIKKIPLNVVYSD